MSTWNDDRLDELSQRTDEGFKEVRQEFKEVRQEMATRAEMNQRFNHLEDGFDRLNNTLLLVGGGIIATLLANGIFG